MATVKSSSRVVPYSHLESGGCAHRLQRVRQVGYPASRQGPERRLTPTWLEHGESYPVIPCARPLYAKSDAPHGLLRCCPRCCRPDCSTGRDMGRGARWRTPGWREVWLLPSSPWFSSPRFCGRDILLWSAVLPIMALLRLPGRGPFLLTAHDVRREVRRHADTRDEGLDLLPRGRCFVSRRAGMSARLAAGDREPEDSSRRVELTPRTIHRYGGVRTSTGTTRLCKHAKST